MISEDVKIEIRTLWNDGMTGSQIGEKLGLSRNAVLGAIHRMRAAGHELAVRGDGVFRPKKKRKFMSRPKLPTRSKADDSADEKRPVGLLKLTPRSCRYIVTHGNFETTKYCNAEALEVGPYCKEHRALCYVPIRKNTGARVVFRFSGSR